MKMEFKKQMLRVLSVALMLSALVSVHETKAQRLTRSQLYRKCIAGNCSEAEKAQVGDDLEKAGVMASPLLYAAAVAVKRAKSGLMRAGQMEAAAEPAKVRLYRRCIAGRCDVAEKAQVRVDWQKAKQLAKKTGKWVGLVAGGLLFLAAIAIGEREAGLISGPGQAVYDVLWQIKRATQQRARAEQERRRKAAERPVMQPSYPQEKARQQEHVFPRVERVEVVVPKVPGQRAILVEPEAEEITPYLQFGTKPTEPVETSQAIEIPAAG